MAKLADCTWEGFSGKGYTYGVYPMGTSFKELPGNYIFAHVENNAWVADHIGITTCLKDRCAPSHEKWDRARRHGATHIHARINREDHDRRAEEADLTALHCPPCNDL